MMKSRLQSSLAIGYLSLVYILFYLPLVVLVVLSFNHSRVSIIWHGFTWHWYEALIHDSQLLVIAWHSLLLSVCSATIACVIGLLGGIAIHKYHFYGKKFCYFLIFILIIIPDLVFAIALLIFFVYLHIRLGFCSLLLAHVTFCLPFVVVLIYNRLANFDRSLFEAGRDLGADDYLLLKRIILPLVWPSLVASWFLSFALSIDDVIISFFVSGPDFQILPLYIFSQVKVGPTPEINALCVVLLLLTVIIVLGGQHCLTKKK